MQSSTPKKSQPRTVDASSVIHSLTANVKDLIDLLPLEDKEVFAYLISHPSEDAEAEPVKQQRFWKVRADGQPKSPRQFNATSKLSDFKKSRSILKKGDHRPSFGCECFQCYMFHWSRWDASPNQEIIHKAILLNESAGPSKCEATTDGRTQWENQPVYYDEPSHNGSLIASNKTEVKNACSKKCFPLNSDEISSLDNAKAALDRDALIEKVTSHTLPEMKNLVAKKNMQKQGRSKISPSKYLSNEEDKPQKKKAAKNLKSPTKVITGQQQGMPHRSSADKKKNGQLSTKYRTKQVAPMDFNDIYAIERASPKSEMTATLEGTANTKDEEDEKVRTHSTHAFSEALSFVADRLLSLWYPRRPRGIEVL